MLALLPYSVALGLITTFGLLYGHHALLHGAAHIVGLAIQAIIILIAVPAIFAWLLFMLVRTAFAGANGRRSENVVHEARGDAGRRTRRHGG